MSRIDEYLRYHVASAQMGDVDPSYGMLLYVCDRFELNVEQRYFLAFHYAMSYCGATAFYHHLEFPDFETADCARMDRWWHARGREESYFQTDRRWPRSRNQVVDSHRSYRDLIRASASTQHEHFSRYVEQFPDLQARYDAVLRWASQIYTFGQFALFLYLEALHTITPLKLCPTDLDLNKAWSCRNGLYYAFGRDDLVDDLQTPIRWGQEQATAGMWRDLRATLAELERPPTIWQTETVLCAFRKWNRGKRWIGYYLDRQGEEIAKMADRVRRGVCWDVLWDYRRENLSPDDLPETRGHLDERGCSPEWRSYRVVRTRETLEEED